MTLPKRRKAPRMGLRAPDMGDIPAYRKWVRGHICLVKGCERRDMEASHIRIDIPPSDWRERSEKGGTGKKPHDKWCLPLCDEHHRELHGAERSFYQKYGIDAHNCARALWAMWPGLWEYEQKLKERDTP